MENTVDRELKRGTLEMILLRLLSERPMYGYELVSTLEQRSGGAFQIKEGTLYPVLYRLEGNGFIEPHWEMLERGAPRKYYRLTESGLAEMQKRIAEWRAFTAAIQELLKT